MNTQNLNATVGTQQKQSEYLLECSNVWALSFAYAMTSNQTLAEQIVADSIVAYISEQFTQNKITEIQNTVPKKYSKFTKINIRLAHYIWEFSKRKATHNIDDDGFFKLLPITRAVCVLKTKAKMNKHQIAECLNLEEDLVELHLSKARLLFSHGKAWIEKSADIMDDGNLECPYWNSSTLRKVTSLEDADIQTLYSQYLGGDLDETTQAAMHAHFTICSVCIKNLVKFKEINQEWVSKIPTITLSNQTKNQFKKYIKQMNYYSDEPEPSFLAGVKRVFQDQKTQIFFVSMILLYVLFKINE